MTTPKWKSDPIAVEIHRRIEERLELGQEIKGPWKHKSGITIEDALEEATDQMIYTMKLLIEIKNMIQGQ